MTTSNLLKDAALRYADNGLKVFPTHGIKNGQCTCGTACGNEGKHPRTARGFHEATSDQDAIVAWWERWPDSNIGIATGKESGVWVLDIDNKHSVEVGNTIIGAGEHSVRQMENEAGEKLPETMTIRTGSGGMHLYFVAGPNVDHPTRAGVRPGVDIRGDGGYVIAPPSLHLSGHIYTVVDDMEPMPAPSWLFEAIAKPKIESTEEDEPIPEGERNQRLHDIGARMRRNWGVNEDDLFALLSSKNKRLCNPPLALDEVARIARNCATYEYHPPVDWSDWTGQEGTAPDIPEGGDLALDLFSFMEHPPEPPEPLVHGVINAGEGGLIAGQANVGKSWLVNDMALAVAAGRPWLHQFETEQGPVLLIDEEGNPFGQWSRFRWLLDGDNYRAAAGLPLYLSIGAGIKLDNEVGLTRIRRMIERYKPRLIIFDSMVRMHKGDENNAQAMSGFFEISKSLMKTYECAILFVHHIRKPSDSSNDLADLIRGTTEIRAWPDMIFVASAGEDKGTMAVKHVKSRWEERIDSFGAKINFFSDDEWGLNKLVKMDYTGKVEESHGSSQSRIVQVIRDLGGEAEAADIAVVVKRAERTIRQHLQTLVRAGQLRQIQVESPGRRPLVKYLPVEPEPSRTQTAFDRAMEDMGR